MPYTLEINHINPRENLFFHQTSQATPELMKAYIDPIVKKHIEKGTWIGRHTYYSSTNATVIQRPTGEWQRTNRISNFTSIAAATEFFKDLIADGPEARTLLRAWQQENGVLNETNILDEDSNIIEVIHACQAHKCMRFGTCPEQGSGCSVVGSTVKSDNYPIYHITPVLAKPLTVNLFSNGQYALIDLYYRHLWINTYSEKMAHEIRKTFWPKASTVVFDLEFFKNYTLQTIDSNVALDWKIDATDLLSPLTNISLSNHDLEKTQTTYTSDILYNESTTTLLSNDRRRELQHEMLFYLEILKAINWDGKVFTPAELDFINNVRQIVQTEINLEIIKEKLIDLAGRSITSPQSLSTKLLILLGSRYG